MQVPLAKLKAILLYFCENTNQRFLGKVKMMKLIYFLDFLHVKRHGIPVTFDQYVNLQHGPIPSAIKNLVDDLADDPEHSVLADTVLVEQKPTEKIQRLVPVRRFSKTDQDIFSPTEIKVLEEVARRFKNTDTATTEDASHKEAPWRETRLLETIPYELAAKDPDCVVDREEIALLNTVL